MLRSKFEQERWNTQEKFLFLEKTFISIVLFLFWLASQSLNLNGLCTGLYNFNFYLKHKSGHVQLRELDREEGGVPKNWCLETVVLEKTFEGLSDSNKIKPVNLKENQPWILTGRTDAEAPVLWSPDANSSLIGKDPGAGKDWEQEKRVSEDEMAGWHHRWCNWHELGQTPGEGERQEVWCVAVHEVTKSQTWPGDWTVTN